MRNLAAGPVSTVSCDELPKLTEFAFKQIRENILRNRDLGRTTLCEQDVALLRQWQPSANLTAATAGLLTVEGWNTMENLARRFQKAFPTLLPTTYNQTLFRFRHTQLQRTVGSVQAFADGLFGLNGHQSVIYDEVPARDTLIRVSLLQAN